MNNFYEGNVKMQIKTLANTTDNSCSILEISKDEETEMNVFSDEGGNCEPGESPEGDEGSDHGEQPWNDSSDSENSTPTLDDGWKVYGNDLHFVKKILLLHTVSSHITQFLIKYRWFLYFFTPDLTATHHQHESVCQTPNNNNTPP
jgi:hypothetical protein